MRIVQKNHIGLLGLDAPANALHCQTEQLRAVKRERHILDVLLRADPPVLAEGGNRHQHAPGSQAAQDRAQQRLRAGPDGNRLGRDAQPSA